MKATDLTAEAAREAALKIREANEAEAKKNAEDLEVVMENILTAVNAGDTDMVVWDDNGDFNLLPHLTPYVIAVLTEKGFEFDFGQDGKISDILW